MEHAWFTQESDNNNYWTLIKDIFSSWKLTSVTFYHKKFNVPRLLSFEAHSIFASVGATMAFKWFVFFAHELNCAFIFYYDNLLVKWSSCRWTGAWTFDLMGKTEQSIGLTHARRFEIDFFIVLLRPMIDHTKLKISSDTEGLVRSVIIVH